ncbi:hypothetical protein HMPREF2531_05021 [Bacteroides intestinalis]|uniref:Uncharacterized protein n=1 Tax=Bacteroides intestinalis TaxID=329854 RepID=A0A139KPK5_9BACE|nr:hypothetical protein HMPREF2531_05021 [Bacteroides intestinalis]
MLQWLCKSPQKYFRLLAEGIIFFPAAVPRWHADNKLPETANPRKDQLVFFKKLLLFMVFI